MINSYRDEIWKDIIFDDKISEREKFKISNYGRLINCKKEEYLVKPSYINGYEKISLRQKSGASTARYIHKIVAQHFLEQGDGIYVIHLNYDKKDNRVSNLKWATKEEKEHHQFSNPTHIKNRKNKRNYSKLTESQVRFIKKQLNDPDRKTRLKMIAKRFNISEMQLYRIKSGENWGWVEV